MTRTPAEYAAGLIDFHGAEEARAIAEAILAATKLPTWAEIEACALAEAEARFEAKGDRFATAEEMESIRSDVMAFDDLFVEAFARDLGIRVVGVLEVERVGEIGRQRVELGREARPGEIA